jgi:aminobenzoyl-glutamate utilization protein B
MSNTQSGKDFVRSWLSSEGSRFYPYADAVWSFAELGCTEHRSSALLCDLLETNGFNVERGVAGMPTAFVASWGVQGPAIGINCEYDALPGLSQQLHREKIPVVEGAPGHGCGHNILGVGSIMAALAVKEWLSKCQLPGIIKVLGSPAEEICVGKPFMARAGLFKGLDAIIDWHPWDHTAANYDTCNAYFSVKYHFRGRTAHGNSPWEGRSALDSGLLMGHAIELLREHISPGNPDAANTINYTFEDVGPEYPNVVSDRCTVWVVGRITTAAEAAGIIERIHRCAEGASLATGTSVSTEFITATHEKIPNRTLAAILHQNCVEVGPPRFDQEEHELAKYWQRLLGAPEVGLSEEVEDFRGGASAVTDNSEFSWFAPFAMVWVTAGPPGIGWHNWQITACSRSSIGKKAMETAAKILATSVVDLLTKPEVLVQAQAEWRDRLAGKTYHSLIPQETSPPTRINERTMEKYRSLMVPHYEWPPGHISDSLGE